MNHGDTENTKKTDATSLAFAVLRVLRVSVVQAFEVAQA
jgi:hypothetical protein